MASACVHTLCNGDDVVTLLALLTTSARQDHDGHYTILAFTTGYKVAFGTPDLSPGGPAYAQVHAMPLFPTLQAAILHALCTEKTFYDYFAGDLSA